MSTIISILSPIAFCCSFIAAAYLPEYQTVRFHSSGHKDIFVKTIHLAAMKSGVCESAHIKTHEVRQSIPLSMLGGEEILNHNNNQGYNFMFVYLMQ